jgi:hypothetical protein
MKIKYDPYRTFHGSKTPVGLYARQKWLDDVETAEWKADFDETVTALLAHQLPDGSWGRSALTTISRLFGLHLTIRSPSHQIDKALRRLIEIQDSDGTWSRSEPEWNTFLAVHALRNKGLL